MSRKKIAIDHAFQLSLFEDLLDTTYVTKEELSPVEKQEEIIDVPQVKKEFVFEHGIKENVWEQYPWLREHQAEDCSVIEKRIYIDGYKGIQCTNGTGVGKAQPLHANILTPNGWVKMGDVKKVIL